MHSSGIEISGRHDVTCEVELSGFALQDSKANRQTRSCKSQSLQKNIESKWRGTEKYHEKNVEQREQSPALDKLAGVFPKSPTPD